MKRETRGWRWSQTERRAQRGLRRASRAPGWAGPSGSHSRSGAPGHRCPPLPPQIPSYQKREWNFPPQVLQVLEILLPRNPEHCHKRPRANVRVCLSLARPPRPPEAGAGLEPAAAPPLPGAFRKQDPTLSGSPSPCGHRGVPRDQRASDGFFTAFECFVGGQPPRGRELVSVPQAGGLGY